MKIEEHETIADIIREMRGYSYGMPPSYHMTMSWHDFGRLLDRLEAAAKRGRLLSKTPENDNSASVVSPDDKEVGGAE